MMRVVLDIGTTRIRGARVDPSGRLEGVVVRDAPALQLEDGRAEQPLDDVVRAVEQVLSTVTGDQSADVAMAVQRGTTVLVDDADQPLGDVISWRDRRSGGVARWMASEEPARWSRVSRTASLASLLAHRWTGVWAEQDATRSPTARGHLSQDARTPLPMRRGGRLWMCGGDKNCELVGAGADAPGKWAVSAGTALSLGTLIDEDAPSVPGTFRTPSPFAGLHTVEVGLPSGGSARSAVERWFGALPPRSALPLVEGPLCVPYFAGSLLDPEARARFVGLDGTETREHLATLVWEGMILELMHSSLRLPARCIPEIGLCGGMADAWFAQCLADALGVTVRLLHSPCVGLVGVASTMGWRVRTPRAERFEPVDTHRWQKRLHSYLAELSGV